MLDTATATTRRTTPPLTAPPAQVHGGPPQDVPAGFLRLPVRYPRAFGDALGYSGDRRFVGFCLWGEGRRLVAYDGAAASAGGYDAHTFASVVAPTAARHGANLGTGAGPATHLFLWDRRRQAAYLAPVASAWVFLEARGACPSAAEAS